MTWFGRAGENPFGMIVYALVAVSALVFIWANQFLPMQDYPDWLFQSYVFSSSIRDDPLQDYELTSYTVPNIISTLLMGATNLLVRPEISGKIFLSVYVVILVLGSAYFFRSAGAGLSNPLCCVPLLFVVSDSFFHGYINYIFSIGVLFCGMGYILSRHSRSQAPNPWIILAVSVVVYLSHATSFVCWLIFIGVFAVRNRSRSNLMKLMLGVAPTLVMLVVYTVSRLRSGVAVGLSAEGGFRVLPHLGYKVSTGISQISLFHRFYPFFDVHAGTLQILAAFNVVFCLAVLFACLYWLITSLKAAEAKRALVMAALVYFALFAFSPHYFAGIFDPGQRFLYPALWLVFATLAVRRGLVKSCLSLRLGQLCVVVLLVIQSLFLHGHAGSISRRMADVSNDLRSARLGSDFELIYESGFDYEDRFSPPLRDLPLLRLPSHSPLDRLHCYLSIEERIHAPIFQTGLISDMRDCPDLSSVSSLEAMTSYPDRMILVGESGGNHFIAGLLEVAYEVEFDHECLVIMRTTIANRPNYRPDGKRISQKLP